MRENIEGKLYQNPATAAASAVSGYMAHSPKPPTETQPQGPAACPASSYEIKTSTAASSRSRSSTSSGSGCGSGKSNSTAATATVVQKNKATRKYFVHLEKYMIKGFLRALSLEAKCRTKKYEFVLKNLRSFLS